MDEPVSDLRPHSLGARGSALWDALMGRSGGGDQAAPVDSARAVLVGEAARLSDRLDRLDQLLSGEIESWVRLRLRDDGGDVEVVIDSAAVEARLTANTLRQLIAQLTSENAARPAGGSIADELAARRAGRGTGT